MLSLRSRSVLFRPRVLAALLLAAIAWGSTFEFTHHHGASSQQLESQAYTSKADAAADQSSFQSQQSSQSSSRSSTSECSICQLHHNLATTLISKLADTRYDVAQAASVTEAAAVHLSEFTATQHGRAPPVLL